ncbi:ubiquitin-like domain-containing protein CIP73 [Amaranthus tricolor]|uniref:ubiquitin-like domain-containing protein CIP73 n=1 Tax=Amaranthus tricolor TaxID=29722 RepID=UPI00258D626D|nr:ubiquitin-like domain-containing protein CIP73 [Amaranthus tricolor]
MIREPSGSFNSQSSFTSLPSNLPINFYDSQTLDYVFCDSLFCRHFIQSRALLHSLFKFYAAELVTIMSDQNFTEGASTSGDTVLVAESNVELNIKTLDSQMYNFRVDKSMLVSSFKEKIAQEVGVPVGQQRLIFRGKVLKDDHLLSDYHVENGDTLHLVVRQPTQPQTSSATSSVDASGNIGTQGIDGSTGVPRNRIGQLSHSVVLGTLNIGDQGEGGASDISRVIGAVLNSLGIGNLATNAAFGAPNTDPTNPVPASQSNDTEQGHGGNGNQSQAGNQAQFAQPFLSQPFHAPLAGISIPSSSLNMPIPSSLDTLSEFMSRMEGVLSQNGYQPSSFSSGTTDQPATLLTSNTRGMPTPEALSIVLRHAERLLSGPAVAALSHIAGRMEQEAGSTNASVRSEIQSESLQVGLAMQHMGALLLELGRTILMLRMGQSPAEAVVNAGHAVYISPLGPNPIMVQPFPHQTSPLFNTPSASTPNTGPSVPVGIVGSAPRNINIHIHAGTSLAPVVSAIGARGAGGDGSLGERGSTASGNSGVNQGLPVRNVIATAVPSRATTIAVTPVLSTSQSIGNVTSSQAPDAAALSSVISQVNSQIRNFIDNMHPDIQNSSGQQENPVVPSSAASGGGSVDAGHLSNMMSSESIGKTHESHVGSVSGQQTQEDIKRVGIQGDSSKSNEESVRLEEPSSSIADGEQADKSTSAKQIPLGLGGGLQPKKRSRQSKMHPVSGEAGPSSFDQGQQARISGQQILQSLASRSTSGVNNSTEHGTGQPQQGFRQSVEGLQSNAQGSDGQFDVTGMMSQLLESPALSGLLSGVAQQSGVGSPDVLRNMLQQFTQNPAMINTVNQLAQQVDTEEFRDMFADMGSGEDGTINFSTMFQQMMPVVSQVLGSGSVQNGLRNVLPGLLPQSGDRRSGENSFDLNSQSNVQEVVQRIALHSPSPDIFHAMVQNAAESLEAAEREQIDGLCSNHDLVDQFVEMLQNDMRQRLEGNPASDGES